MFRTINGNRQLIHYGSKKFVHPRGGTVGQGTPLVLDRNDGGKRTSITMKKIDGRTYLVNGADERFFAHPEGGSSHPGDDTWLVWYDQMRPGVAIEVEPAEDYELLEVEYDKRAMDNLVDSELVMSSLSRNYGTEPSVETVTITYDKSITNSVEHTFSASLSITIKYSVKVGAPGGPEVSKGISFTVGFTATKSTSYSKTEGLQVSYQRVVTTPANSSMLVEFITRRGSGSVPFKAKARSLENGREVTLTGTAQLELFWNQDFKATPVPLNFPEPPRKAFIRGSR